MLVADYYKNRSFVLQTTFTWLGHHTNNNFGAGMRLSFDDDILFTIAYLSCSLGATLFVNFKMTKQRGAPSVDR